MSLKIRYNSPVVLSFSLICAAIFFIDRPTGGAITNEWFTLHSNFSFASPGDWLTLFTYVIGHANVEHLMGNLAFILLLGPILEEKYGSRNLLLMMAVTAMVTGVLNILFFSTGILGASGIVFMYIILVSFSNVRQGEIPLTFILVLLLFVGKEVFQSLSADNVSQFGHILGGLCGSFFGFKGSGPAKA